jgi:sodium-dependent phosphate cotransporter
MVNFGQRLIAQSVDEWASGYLNYERLKQCIDALKQDNAALTTADATFFALLDAELAKVNQFNDDMLSKTAQALSSIESMARDKARDVKLESTTSQLHSLRSFVALNYMAVVKIVKKFNKNFPGAHNEPLSALLLRQSFYTSTRLGELFAQQQAISGESPSSSAPWWVLSSDGPHDAVSLLSTSTRHTTSWMSSTPACGSEYIAIPTPMCDGPRCDTATSTSTVQKTLILALFGVRMEAMLLANTPNMDDMIDMSSSDLSQGASNLNGGNHDIAQAKLLTNTLSTIFSESNTQASAPGATRTFGGQTTDDATTIAEASAYIRSGASADMVVVHLNAGAAIKRVSIDNLEYKAAIESMDTNIGQLISALRTSEAAWNNLVCTDSTSTQSCNASALLALTPPALLSVDNKPGMGEDDTKALSWPTTILYILMALSCLYGFLFGLGLMGDAFKVLGGKTAGDMFTSISNPVAGLMVGIVATVLVQSSSTSTSVVVGMVGADIISVHNAIPIIMGANIGTSVTNTIVSMGQMGDPTQYKQAFSGATVHDCFNLLSVAVFLPLEVITNVFYHLSEALTSGLAGSEGGKFKSPIKIVVSPLVKLFLKIDKKKINKISEGKLNADDAGSLTTGGWFGEMPDETGGAICLVLSLLVLCVCLYGIVVALQKLVMGNAKEWIRSSLKWSETWWGGYLSMLVGMGATIAVQSSSITTSTLTPLVGVGVITLEQMLPLTLGANIGTTCTGLLASLVSAKRNALQIALVHLMFNIFGIMLWYPVPFMREVPLRMARSLGVFAYNYKWFPLAYIAFAFVVMPLIFLGIARLFSSGAVGVVFGIFTLLIIVGVLSFAVYAYYYRGGQEWMERLATNTETPEDVSSSVHTNGSSSDVKLEIVEGVETKE